MADHLVDGPPNKRPKLSENAISENSDLTFRLWDLENSLPEELMGSGALDPSDIPTQNQASQPSAQQNLLNGTGESVPVEGNAVGSATSQRHQQLSQLLQTKPNVSHSTVPTPPTHSGIPTTQRIPSPSVSLATITAVKSPHPNNLTPTNTTVNKSGTPVSSTHISVSDANSSNTNISNSIANSLSNTTGNLGINSNMLLMQSKGNTIGSQNNLVSLSTSVTGSTGGNNNNQHHPPIAVVQPQQVNQQTNTTSHINGSHMPLGNTSSLNMNRGVNPSSVSSAVTHSTVNTPHQNILGHPSLSNQGANLK